MTKRIDNVVQDFRPVSLDQLDQVALMRRVDTKFILSIDLLPALLKRVQQDYSVLEIAGQRLFTYNSVYFDTPSSDFYLDHHNQRNRRTKVRLREYADAGLTYVEVKQKDVKGNTIKMRQKVETMSDELSLEAREFVESLIGRSTGLEKSLKNSFERFTLMSALRHERITVDMRLSYEGTLFNEKLVIVELKQLRYHRGSPLVVALKALGVHPTGISKYCLGMADARPGLKQNRWKQTFRKVKKATE